MTHNSEGLFSQSWLSKKGNFLYFISDHNSTLLHGGTDSWLTTSISNSEVFTPDYNAYRNYRPVLFTYTLELYYLRIPFFSREVRL